MMLLTFTEFEAFAEAVQEASMTMRITAFSEPKWTLQYEIVGSVRLQKGFEGGGNVTEGVTFDDAWTFFHPLDLPIHTNGQVAKADEVFVAPPHSEFCLACRPPHGWLTVAIPTSQLFQTPQELDFADAAIPQVLQPGANATQRFASLVERFLATAEVRPQLLDSNAAVDAFEHELVEAARGLFARCHRSPLNLFSRWHQQMKFAVGLALSHPMDALSISDLAQRIGVSERSLRRSFQRCYGLSPMQWMRVYRLHQARQLLKASCPDVTTVTQVAFEVGFWDLGRFAGAYRRLFGELPSQTLRRSARG